MHYKKGRLLVMITSLATLPAMADHPHYYQVVVEQARELADAPYQPSEAELPAPLRNID